VDLHRYRLIFSIIVLVIIAVTSIYYGLTSILVQDNPNDITITVNVIDEKGNSIKEGINVYAQLWILPAPGYNKSIELFRGRLEENHLKIPLRNRVLQNISRKWIQVMKIRGEDYKHSSSALQIALWVINSTSHKIVKRAIHFIPYKPIDIILGRGSRRELVIKITQKDKDLAVREPGNIVPMDGNVCEWVPVWELQWSVSPDTNPDIFGDDIVVRNGINYLKTPILYVYNDYSISGFLTGSITIYLTETMWYGIEFKPSLGIGYEIENKINSGDPSGGLDGKIMFGGYTVRKYGRMTATFSLAPGDNIYVWILTRPVVEFYKEKMMYCCGAYCSDEYYTGYELIQMEINDVYIEDDRIEHGVSESELPSWYKEYFLNGTQEQVLEIPGTDLEDGWLGVGEDIEFPDIFDYMDQYDVDMEICISGALLASLVPAKFKFLTENLAVSLSWGESAELFIFGELLNYGEKHGIGYDVAEKIYIRIAQLRYTTDSGYTFDVPMGIYFRSW